MNVGELFVSLGFDVDDVKLRDFNDKIVQGRNEMLALSAVATGAVYTLNAFLEKSINNAVALSNLTNEFGINAEAAQRWQIIVQKTNPALNADEALASYKKVNDYLTQASLGKGAGSLNLLGVNYFNGMTVSELIEQVRLALPNARKNFTPSQISTFIQDIFGTSGVLNAIQTTPEEGDRLTAGMIRTHDELAAQKQLKDAIIGVELEWNNFLSQLSADWSRDLITGVHKADDALLNFIENVKVVYAALEQWKAVTVPLGIALGVTFAASFAAASPLLTTLIAIGIAINDIGNAIRGLPSFSGPFTKVEKKGLDVLFSDPGKFIENIGDTISNLYGKSGVDGFLERTDNHLRRLNGYTTDLEGKPLDGGNASSNEFNVTQHIHSLGDPQEVAREGVQAFHEYNQGVISGIYLQTNQGPLH